jgi:hypothetical protein
VAKLLNKPADWNTFRKIRNDVTSLVRKSRDAYQHKLVSRLSDDHPSTRTWWKTCNQISGLKPSHYGIPPLLRVLFPNSYKFVWNSGFSSA